MRIVVVEDEVRIREGICNLIGKMFPDHRVVGSAENGEEGLKLILRENPDLIITDVKMPLMDGLKMLSLAYQNDKRIRSKAIVLSAYAEFSYAQQAMRWGVSEYLIKPLVVGEFVQAIKNIEKQNIEEEKQNPEILGRLDNIIFGIIFGSIDVDENLCSYIKEKYGFDAQFSEIQVYLGNQYIKNIIQMRKDIERFLSAKKDLSHCLLEIPKERMLLCILYGYKDQNDIERWFQNGVITKTNETGVPNNSYGWINATGISELKNSYYTLLKYMDWNISFGDKIMISYPKILQVRTSICIYPNDIEMRLKAALCSLNRDAISRCINSFNDYFDSGQIYDPKEIKESYVRFLWAMINVAKEIGVLNYDQLEQQKILERIMGAVNRKELKEVTDEIFNLIGKDEVQSEEQLSLNVKRAKSMVMEYYQIGINLEEIAAKLNLTPEYLGMIFHKETGVKFSTYIKEYRIAKAKELLIGSELKINEVAEKVGYSDAKYFSRVFRELTGQLPVEYRRANK
ncbi:MAG: helix-turn-helix domain-containing protein [Clostridiaceae bacterium]|nr:helix-turn-helix domain-containing protein [Clostridiaceae bacterium]